MANFRTHITTSSVLGVGYTSAGIAYFHDEAGALPLASCVLAGGMCSIAGMLPDIDSETGIPLRETMAFGAAAVPMMMVDRFQQIGMSHQSIVLAGVGIYLFIRFVVAWMIKKYTVHRGMFHSIPAAIIATELGFLLACPPNLMLRYYMAGGVFLGFMSHLLLDEWYSVDTRRGRIRLKKSFGTAVKFWGNSTYANISTYVKVGILTMMVFSDPIVMERLSEQRTHMQIVDKAQERTQNYHRVALEGIQSLFK